MIEGKRRAIVIGINKYGDDRIPTLAGAENDAREIYERLRNPSIGNFEIKANHYLLGKKATSKRIRQAISDVFWQTDSCDLALLYFSGHGFVDGYDDGYVAPYDFSIDEPFVCGANMSELKSVLSRSHNSSVLLILDCCYSGISTKGDKAIPDYRASYEASLEHLSGEGRVIFASSTPDQVSRESTFKHYKDDAPHEHGVFSYHLVQALDGGASDAQGFISLTTLQNHMEQQFQNDAEQTPRFFTVGSNLSTIKLALATDKYNQNISSILSEARKFLDQKSFASLVRAARRVVEVIEINSKHQEARDLEREISKTLGDEGGRMQTWVTMNEANVRPSLDVVFPEFDRLVYTLSFDEIAKLPDRDLTLLILLNRVTIGELDHAQFITKCAPFNNPESRPQPISDPASRPPK